MVAKCVLAILELNSNQRFRGRNICRHIAHVVHTTAKPVISRRGKSENVHEISENE